MTFILDQTPFDSPFFVLGDAEASLAVPGRDFLLEFDGTEIATSTLTTFYFGSRGYSHPTAPGFYVPRLSQPLNFRRDIYSERTTGGANRVSYGEIRLINNDGDLDYLRDFAVIGQRFRMLIGYAGHQTDPGADYDTFEPLVSGRIGRILFGANAAGASGGAESNAIVLQVRDRLQDFQQAVQVNKFLGTEGLEGGADIKDRPKPLPVGPVQNMTPPCVSTSLLIWQVIDFPAPTGSLVLTVYDRGAEVSRDFDYTDLADMEANAPSPGFVRVLSDINGNYFRLGSTPTGTITCDVSDREADADNTAAQVALRIAARTPETGEGGITDDDVNFDDVDTLDAANPAVVGIDATSETYISAISKVLGSIGAWFGFDRLGIFRMQRLEYPALPYVTTFRQASLDDPLAIGEYNILAYRFLPTNDPEQGEPVYRVEVEYSVNYTVQASDAIAGSVSDMDRRNFLAVATRTQSYEDTTVQDLSPFATKKTVSTQLLDSVDAINEANRLQVMLGAPRDFLEIDLALTSDLIALVDIGAVINIVLPRADYIDSKILRVIGMSYNAAQGTVTLVCWG